MGIQFDDSTKQFTVKINLMTQNQVTYNFVGADEGG